MTTLQLLMQLQQILSVLNDTHPAYFVLTTLHYAVECGRMEQLEDAITPLVDLWLTESVGAEDVLDAYQGTVLG